MRLGSKLPANLGQPTQGGIRENNQSHVPRYFGVIRRGNDDVNFSIRAGASKA
jgi:hypothetical protein